MVEAGGGQSLSGVSAQVSEFGYCRPGDPMRVVFRVDKPEQGGISTQYVSFIPKGKYGDPKNPASLQVQLYAIPQKGDKKLIPQGDPIDLSKFNGGFDISKFSQGFKSTRASTTSH